MKGKVERFQITDLHGYKSFDLRLQDNTIILVGENGSGKTTVLRLLYYLLSGQWTSLAQYKFRELSITIDSQQYKLPCEWLKTDIPTSRERDFMMSFPPHVRRELMMLLETGGPEVSWGELELYARKIGVQSRYLARALDRYTDAKSKYDKELTKLLESIAKSISSQVLYLPTYRRIEQELNLIFKEIDDDVRRHRPSLKQPRTSRTFVELIEFGMNDVDDAVDDTLKRLKDFDHNNLNALTLGYLGDVVDQRYTEVDTREIRSTPEETIRNVLDRIPEAILSKTQKDHLFEKVAQVRAKGKLDEHAKVVCHYFLKLLHIQDELRKKEHPMTAFCDVCNQYMGKDKQFHYDSSGFKFYIKTPYDASTEGGIKLKHLSSGEKQIVSLFSHLYLSGGKNYFVLIDEPELSLSVPWQRRFLTDIKNGGFCAGLVAATHSPFIYDNELKPYARGIGEFEL